MNPLMMLLAGPQQAGENAQGGAAGQALLMDILARNGITTSPDMASFSDALKRAAATQQGTLSAVQAVSKTADLADVRYSSISSKNVEKVLADAALTSVVIEAEDTSLRTLPVASLNLDENANIANNYGSEGKLMDDGLLSSEELALKTQLENEARADIMLDSAAIAEAGKLDAGTTDPQTDSSNNAGIEDPLNRDIDSGAISELYSQTQSGTDITPVMTGLSSSSADQMSEDKITAEALNAIDVGGDGQGLPLGQKGDLDIAWSAKSENGQGLRPVGTDADSSTGYNHSGSRGDENASQAEGGRNHSDKRADNSGQAVSNPLDPILFQKMAGSASDLSFLVDQALGIVPGSEFSLSPNPSVTLAQAHGHMAAQAPLHPATVQVAMTIGKALQNGQQHINIALDPPELGRVNVKLSYGRDDQSIRAHIVTDNKDTFMMLQRDAHALHQALSSAGLEADAGNLSFELADQGGGFEDFMSNQQDGENKPANAQGSGKGAPADVAAVGEEIAVIYVDPATGRQRYSVMA